MPGPNFPYTQLDSSQVLQQSFDETNDRLRVDATFSGTIGDVVIHATDSDIAIADRTTGNLLKINADGSIDANVIVSAASGDNIAISDGTDTLEINPDGSINVSVIENGTDVNVYNAVNSVASNTLTTVASYTATGNGKLKIIEASGTNISRYDVELNSAIIARKYTNFGSSLNETFDFKDGLNLVLGDVILLRTIHQRNTVGDFNGRIQVRET